ncbi:MAG: AAA family ATPase [Candidatus Latescibacteria bacterium]|nr:AAA family ATPase [Candidatus Latescibacterota bacterium]
MESQNLPTLIVQILRDAGRPLLAREIAEALSKRLGGPIDRGQVNRSLYNPNLRTVVAQDNSYRWTLKGSNAPPVDHAQQTHQISPEASSLDSHDEKGRLSRVLDYYLECVREDGGIEAECYLSGLNKSYLVPPLAQEWQLGGGVALTPSLGQEASDFLKSLRQKGNNAALYYGYPVFVKWIKRSRSGWAGGFVSPVFCQQIEFSLDGSDLHLRLAPGWPRVNSAFTETVFPTPEERRNFLDSLGLLTMEGDPPEDGIAEIVRRMVYLGSPTAEMEPLDPENLALAPPVSSLSATGLYNRTILVLGERAKFTQGLERELTMIRDEGMDSALSKSALRFFFGSAQSSSADTGDVPLVEVVSLNEEQRQAVRSALCNDLTVVTGPPGTGKSQIVTTILANAYLKGQRVLFTSRNHKAIDVVEARTNGLSSVPIVIRTGTKAGERNLRSEILQFLTQVLSIAATEQDRRADQESTEKIVALQTSRARLWDQLERLRQTRNRVDLLDQEITRLEEHLPPEVWSQIQHLEASPKVPELPQAVAALEYLCRDLGPILRLIRWFRKKGLLNRVASAEQALRSHAWLGEPPAEISPTNFARWVNFFSEAEQRLAASESWIEYRSALNELLGMESSEKLAEQLAALDSELWDWGSRLIAAHGRLLADRLRRPDLRKAIADFRATVERLANDQIGGQSYAQLRCEQEQLFDKVAEVLPAWCVTNLQASGSLPFQPALYDLAIIDEASQCDIPSAIPILFRARRALIIGDPHQLRHISNIGTRRDQQLQVRHGLTSATDLVFGYEKNSLFDLAAAFAEALPLRDHFRSHEQIVEFSNRHWYQGTLRVCTDYRRLANVGSEGPRVQWKDVRGRTVRPVEGGARNDEEAQAVVAELENLLVERDFRGTVGVVTPFRAQANRIQMLVNERLDLSVIERSGLIVNVVHSFQGDERDVILMSLCITPDLPRGARYFLETTGNLFNVSITRARAMLKVVGDLSAAASCRIKHVEAFAAYVANLQSQQAPDIPKDPWSRSSVGHWEQPFYEALVRAGLRPIPQFPAYQYRLDLAIVEDGIQLDIEVDGELYHREWDSSRARSDLLRDLRLQALGWTVKRFWVYRLRQDMEACVAEVVRLVERLSERVQTSPKELTHA